MFLKNLNYCSLLIFTLIFDLYNVNDVSTIEIRNNIMLNNFEENTNGLSYNGRVHGSN